MSISRRNFLKTTSASLGFAGMQSLFLRSANASPSASSIAEGFGPLQADPHRILDLPKGFTYRVISWAGDPMEEDLIVPGAADGMAAFAGPDGKTILVRNHEISAPSLELGAFGRKNGLLDKIDAKRFYDNGGGEQPCLGGTTTLLYNPRSGETERQFLSLAGTQRNCAGGLTPWGSWISCEENTQRAEAPYEKDHGYCFEVPSDIEAGPAKPEALVEMGRFNHEAVAVDPASGVVYLTEDRHDSLLYRYIPNVPGELLKGGKLQALAIKGQKSLDTRNWETDKALPVTTMPDGTILPGTTFETTWIDLEDIQAPEDDLRLRGHEQGAALFARGEGIWYGNDAVYVACTNGGSAYKGQIWKYVPSAHEGTDGEQEAPGMLSLFIEPNDGGLVDNADNLTVAPWGDLILCEDGSGDEFLVGVTPQGGIYKFARNATPQKSELAGACFSADGETLFVNIQSNGMTLAITGPWGQAQRA